MSGAANRGKTVVLVGAGGNIGSQLVPHLARTPDIGRVVLVDGDRYEERNLWTQNIRRRDLGQLKATVQRRVLREIDGSLAVEAIADLVENVPLGRLRGDVLLSAVDSKAARRSINTITTRLGMPWIDAGVNGDELLARINVYRPDPARACHECHWTNHDYATIETRHPCTARETTAATNAPSALGALAAALQALECQKLLAATADDVTVARQVVVGAGMHRTLVTTLTRNPRCRFDHARLELLPVAPSVATCTLGEAFALGRRVLGTDEVALGVPGQVFATRLSCLACRSTHALEPYLWGRLTAGARTCAACGGAMEVAGFDACEWLAAAELGSDVQQFPLHRLGLRSGDVVSVTDEEHVAHFECGGES